MRIAELLYQLQKLDETIRAQQQRLAQIQAQLGESEALKTARRELEEAQKELQRLERLQRQQELELETLSEKLTTEEERLYGGRVTNPKELAGLQKEVRYLKEGRSQLEDKLLETMMAREEVAGQVAQKQAQLAAVQATWETEQSDLMQEKEELEAALEEAMRRRNELVQQIPAHALSTYEHLQRTKGIAVAPVESDMCTGCRVTLSAVDRQRVTGNDLVLCSNCGRILVVLS